MRVRRRDGVMLLRDTPVAIDLPQADCEAKQETVLVRRVAGRVGAGSALPETVEAARRLARYALRTATSIADRFSVSLTSFSSPALIRL